MIRTIAAKQLLFEAEAGDGAAVERLGTLLEDPDPGIPWIALTQLAELRSDPRARERLEHCARHGRDEALRGAAQRATQGPAALTACREPTCWTPTAGLVPTRRSAILAGRTGSSWRATTGG